MTDHDSPRGDEPTAQRINQQVDGGNMLAVVATVAGHSGLRSEGMRDRLGRPILCVVLSVIPAAAPLAFNLPGLLFDVDSAAAHITALRWAANDAGVLAALDAEVDQRTAAVRDLPDPT